MRLLASTPGGDTGEAARTPIRTPAPTPAPNPAPNPAPTRPRLPTPSRCGDAGGQRRRSVLLEPAGTGTGARTLARGPNPKPDQASSGTDALSVSPTLSRGGSRSSRREMAPRCSRSTWRPSGGAPSPAGASSNRPRLYPRHLGLPHLHRTLIPTLTLTLTRFEAGKLAFDDRSSWRRPLWKRSGVAKPSHRPHPALLSKARPVAARMARPKRRIGRGWPELGAAWASSAGESARRHLPPAEG